MISDLFHLISQSQRYLFVQVTVLSKPLERNMSCPNRGNFIFVG